MLTVVGKFYSFERQLPRKNNPHFEGYLHGVLSHSHCSFLSTFVRYGTVPRSQLSTVSEPDQDHQAYILKQ